MPKSKKYLIRILIVLIVFGINVEVNLSPHRKENLRPVAFALSSDKKLGLDLKRLVDTIGDVEKVCSTLTGLLDFGSNSLEQALTNITIINLFSELGVQYKTLSVAEKIAEGIEHKVPYQELVKRSVVNFFESIPDELAFQSIENSRKAADKIEKELPVLDDISLYLRELRRHPMLTRMGEFKFGVLGCLGDEEATKELASSNLRIVVSIAKNFTWSRLPLTTLISAGNLGLMESAKKFKPQKQGSFYAYAYDWIRGKIIEHIAETKSTISISKWHRQMIGRYKRECARRNIDPKDGNIDDSVVEDIATVLGIAGKKIRKIPHMIFAEFSLQQLRRDRGEGDREATIEAEIGREDREIKETECIDILARIIMETEDRLPSRWRPESRERNIKIYRLRILTILTGRETRTLREIGPELDVSYERVRIVEKDAEEEIGRVLRGLDVNADYLRAVMAFAKEKWTPEELEKILWEKIAELREGHMEIDESECIDVLARVVIGAEDVLSEEWGWSRVRKEKMRIFRLIALPLLRDEALTRNGRPISLKEAVQECNVEIGMYRHLRLEFKSEMLRTVRRLAIDYDYFKGLVAFARKKWSAGRFEQIVWERIAGIRREQMEMIEETECIETMAKIVIYMENRLRPKWRMHRREQINAKVFRLIALSVLRNEAPIEGDEPMGLKDIDRKCGAPAGRAGVIKDILRQKIERAKKLLGLEDEHFRKVIASSKQRWTLEELDKILWERIAKIRRYAVRAEQNLFTAMDEAA